MTHPVDVAKDRPVVLSVAKERKGHRLTIQLDVDEPGIVRAISQTLDDVLNLFVAGNDGRMRLKAERILEALYDRVEPSPATLEEVLQIRKSVDRLFASGKWFTREQIHRAHPKARNSSEPASDWKRRGRIFAVNYDGVDYFPQYQFDQAMQPLPVIADILKALGPIADSWAIAAWMNSPNGWLNGKAPRVYLDDSEKIVHAARMRKESYVA